MKLSGGFIISLAILFSIPTSLIVAGYIKSKSDHQDSFYFNKQLKAASYSSEQTTIPSVQTAQPDVAFKGVLFSPRTYELIPETINAEKKVMAFRSLGDKRDRGLCSAHKRKQRECQAQESTDRCSGDFLPAIMDNSVIKPWLFDSDYPMEQRLESFTLLDAQKLSALSVNDECVCLCLTLDEITQYAGFIMTPQENSLLQGRDELRFLKNNS